MSIEKNTMATSSKAVASAASHSGKGKVKSSGEADAVAGAGFASLLTSLESGTDPIEVAEMSLSVGEQPQMAATPSVDPLIPAAPGLPLDLSMLLAQASEVAGGKLDAASDERSVGMVAGARVTAPVLLAQAAEGGDKSGKASDEQPVGSGGIRLTGPAIGAVKAEISVAASTSPEIETSGDFRQKVNALLEQTAQALPALTSKARGAAFQSGADVSLAEARAFQLANRLDVSGGESVVAGAMVTSGIGDSVLRQADRVAAKSLVLSGGYGIESPWGQLAMPGGSHVEAPSAMADPSMPTLEAMVADTVSYWVTQGVQNAELKLDGFGGQPVEVSISLKGDEAQIDFRSDQPEIRQILEGAVAQLKDLLTSEGLVLSGVSVGASGQEGGGAQEQRNRPGARQAAITTTDLVPTERLQRGNQSGNQSVGRVVDLFV